MSEKNTTNNNNNNNNEVLDGLSFGSRHEAYVHAVDPTSDPSPPFSPLVAPPASAPPPPPPPPPSSPPPPPPPPSYQGGRAARQPSIENYGTPEGSALPSRGFVLFNPNTGHSNATEGFALREVVLFMRMLNLSLCTLTIVLEALSWIGEVLSFQPTHLVLGLYLTFFSGLLCCYELHTPYLSPFLKDYFGLLYNPHGRAFVLFLMAGIALGQKNLLERLLGLVMLLNSAYTVYLACAYPQYEKIHQLEAENDLVSRAQEGVSQYAWANPHRVARAAFGGGGDGDGAAQGNGTRTADATAGETQRLI